MDIKVAKKFDPIIYNKSNQFQYKDANDLIERIKEDNNNIEFDIVLDFGCGTGNVTLMLNSLLSIKQIYAIDVDPEMIDFANENHPKNNIKYILQDLSQEWDQLSPEIKALENKVSLIFSNHVLHWIIDKENLANNLYRLLSKNGKFFSQIYWITDLFNDLTGIEKEIHEKEVLKVPTKEEQLNLWTNVFEEVGFGFNETQFISRKTAFDYETFHQCYYFFNNRSGLLISNVAVVSSLLPLVVFLRKAYFVEKNESKRDQVMKEMSNEFIKRALSRTRQFTDESNGEVMVEFSYGYFRFNLEKI